MQRRQFITAGMLSLLAPHFGIAGTAMQTRPVPGTGETLPVIGLGTSRVFDVGSAPEAIGSRREVVAALVNAGGSVIDTSPMYDRSERVIGEVLDASALRESCFLATKVWTDGSDAGERQMRRSAALMNTDRIDLMQVHNRRDMDSHWPTILALKESGFIRYNGVTDYRESAHRAMQAIMRRYRPEFVQINYSLGERGAEDELLPLAADLGIAVIVNRPFMAGRLFRAVGDRPLPGWAKDYVTSWGQFFLKFIVSHPAVTCVIPATSKLKHMVDNAAAGFGPMPNAKTRRRMADFIDTL